jgi:hypothetical protein
MIPYDGVVATVAARENEHGTFALTVLNPLWIRELREEAIMNLKQKRHTVPPCVAGEGISFGARRA